MQVLGVRPPLLLLLFSRKINSTIKNKSNNNNDMKTNMSYSLNP